MAEDDSMGMTIWTMLSSQLGLMLLVVAYFGESQNSELRARSTGLTKFVWPVQKSRQNLSLPNFQFGNRGRT